MKNNSVSTQVLDELLTTIEVIGLDNTIKNLKEAKSNFLTLDDYDIDFILSSVVKVTGVSKDSIIFGRDRNDERKISVALCVHFIKDEFNYSYSDIKKILKKDEAALWRYNSIIENVPTNPKTEFDKKISGYIKKVKLLLTEKKLKKQNGK